MLSDNLTATDCSPGTESQNKSLLNCYDQMVARSSLRETVEECCFLPLSLAYAWVVFLDSPDTLDQVLCHPL